MTGQQELAIKEYDVLRSEMVKRIELKQRITEIVILSFGATVAIGPTVSGKNRILVVYPVIVLFLAAAWLHHNIFLMKLGNYICEVVEPVLTANVTGGWKRTNKQHSLGYETYLREFEPIRQAFLGGVSTIGLFLTAQIVALSLGVALGDMDATEWILVVISVVAISMTLVLLLYYRRLPSPEEVEFAVIRGEKQRPNTQTTATNRPPAT